MALTQTICGKCKKPVPYHRVYCRCDHFIGYPNFRSAQAEAANLDKRYHSACRRLLTKKADVQLKALERIVADALPVISVSYEACDDILRSKKYMNYHKRLESSLRIPANPENHGERQMVGERLYPSFSHNIHYAALSSDGHGLPSYGPMTLRWQVDRFYLQGRISILEDNSFTFFPKHGLGTIGAAPPLGYQSTWVERHKLVVAKLCNLISHTTPVAKLPQLLLQPASSRKTDDFVEIAVYEDDGLDTQDVDMLTVENPPTKPEEHHRWQIIVATARARNIVIN